MLGADVELDEDFYFIARQRAAVDARRRARPRLRAPARARLRRAHGGDDARADAPRPRRADRAERGARAAAQPGPKPVVVAASGLRVGSRIVQTKNDYTVDREVMNGEVAFILDFDEEEGEARLSLDEGEREIIVPVTALATYDLGWALTVHRSQGSQFPAVVAPWSTAYSRDALARAALHRRHPRAAALCARRRAAGGRDRARARGGAAAQLRARRRRSSTPPVD